jgi:hypothetical protein
MTDSIKDVIMEEQGNAGAIRILSALRTAALQTASSTEDLQTQNLADVFVKNLEVVIKALKGEINPDNIDLEKLFVPLAKEHAEEIEEVALAKEEESPAHMMEYCGPHGPGEGVDD